MIFAMNALLLALLLMGTVSANSLMFYNSADNCDITTDHIGCYMYPARVCCNSHAPFCTRLLLSLGTPSPGDTYTQYFIHRNSCHLTKNGGSFCTQGGPDNSADCCIGVPPGGDDGSTCSAFWLDGGTGDSPPGWKEEIDGDRGCMNPNYMSYNDGSGPKEIFLPSGTFQHALDAYDHKNFSALIVYRKFAEVMGNVTGIVS